MSRIRAAFLESTKERVRDSGSDLPELCKNQLSSPDFSLASQSVSSDEFQPSSVRLISKLKWSAALRRASSDSLLTR